MRLRSSPHGQELSQQTGLSALEIQPADCVVLSLPLSRPQRESVQHWENRAAYYRKGG